MFLRQITLTNFKCHDRLCLSFQGSTAKAPVRKTTFILGENGTGKTAVLKAIALITAGSSALGQLLGNPDEWIKNGKGFCSIEATLVTAKGVERHLTLRIGRKQTLSRILAANESTLVEIDAALTHANRNYFVVAYGAGRRLNKDTREGLNLKHYWNSPRLMPVQNLFAPEQPLVSLSSWAMDLDYRSAGNGLSTVKSALNSFLIADVAFKHIDKKKRQLIFSTPDGEVPLEQLSEGYQNVSGWVGDLLFQVTNTFKDYRAPLNARGLLLIDEIDLHLHPRWQRKLHAFLKERLPNFQIIATTHSPLTAQQAEENELYALKREGAKVELAPFMGDPSKILVHQLLMSPVFGLPTDESVRVEEAKATVRAKYLKGNKKTAAKPKARSFQEEAGFLKTVPANVRTNSLLDETDLELLSAISSELDRTVPPPTKAPGSKPSAGKARAGKTREK